MHTISIFVDKNRMPKPASYFECQTHLAKNLRNAANFIIRNLRTGLKKDPVDRTSNEEYQESRLLRHAVTGKPADTSKGSQGLEIIL